MMLPIHGPRARLSTLCALTASALLPTTALAAEYVQKNITDPFGYKLLPHVSSVPAPLRVAPDQSFSGIDGSWNTFTINVGDPQALVQVYASTASQQIWVVNREACFTSITDPESDQTTESNLFDSDCETSRGYLYNNTASKTWVEKGFYALWLEKNIGYGGANGFFGYDSMELGIRGEKGPYVQNTTIGTLVTDKFWHGHIGLHPKPTNFSAFEPPVDSYMTTLFKQKNIPSLSFGYTAGARYHGSTVLGSLTLGGYDRSRIIPNDLTFIMAPNNERDLVVGVAGLTANTTQSSNISLLKRDDLNMFIDSTIAEIWLPEEICDAFAEAFGLKFDNTTQLYLVDDTLHQTLLAQNPSVTFTLGQKYSTDSTVQITLPYAAFDLEASPPYRGLKQKTKYFPIRRGNDTEQWILGRTFLQEAYITVDWERANFSLSAVDWNFKNQPDLLPIVSPNYAEVHYDKPKGSGASLAPGAVIGIAVGCGFTFALVLCAVGWWYWRRRHQRKLAALEERYQVEAADAAAKKKIDPENPDEPPLSPVPEDVKTNVFPKAELPGDSGTHFEIGSDLKDKDRLPTINEADNNEPQIFEMPGDMPELQEAGGRQLSEKETMVVRERIYNGIDPNGEPEISPVNDDPYRRLAPISPSEVTMVNGRIPSSPGSNISPVTPRSPRDGAFLEATDTFFQLPPYRPPREGRSPEDTLLSPISPLEGSTDTSRRRFSYES